MTTAHVSGPHNAYAHSTGKAVILIFSDAYAELYPVIRRSTMFNALSTARLSTAFLGDRQNAKPHNQHPISPGVLCALQTFRSYIYIYRKACHSALKMYYHRMLSCQGPLAYILGHNRTREATMCASHRLLS